MIRKLKKNEKKEVAPKEEVKVNDSVEVTDEVSIETGEEESQEEVLNEEVNETSEEVQDETEEKVEEEKPKKTVKKVNKTVKKKKDEVTEESEEEKPKETKKTSKKKETVKEKEETPSVKEEKPEKKEVIKTNRELDEVYDSRIIPINKAPNRGFTRDIELMAIVEYYNTMFGIVITKADAAKMLKAVEGVILQAGERLNTIPFLGKNLRVQKRNQLVSNPPTTSYETLKEECYSLTFTKDMTIPDKFKGSKSEDGKTFIATAQWDYDDKEFKELEKEVKIKIKSAK